MKKMLILVLTGFFLVSSASASLFGTFPYQLEQQSDDLSTQIGVGVVNTGDEELKLEFSTLESREYNVSNPEKVRLEPSEITSDPEGENWYYVGDGKYVKVKQFYFDVEISKYRDSNRIDIPLNIVASNADASSGSSAAAVSQFRSYNYTILLNPRLRPLERDTGEEKTVYWQETDERSLPDDWKTDSGEAAQEDENLSKDYKARETDENTGERDQSGVNKVTMILVIAIIGCIGYIKVI